MYIAVLFQAIAAVIWYEIDDWSIKSGARIHMTYDTVSRQLGYVVIRIDLPSYGIGCNNSEVRRFISSVRIRAISWTSSSARMTACLRSDSTWSDLLYNEA